MTIAVPYSWLKQISKEQLQSDTTPLFGYSPLFPWGEMAEAIAKSLKDETFTITPQAWEHLQPDDFFQGAGVNPRVLSFDLSPLAGNAFFVIAENELQRLISVLLTKTSDATDIIDEDYESGIIHFLVYEAFNSFRQLDFGKPFTPHLLDSPLLPEQSCYSQTFTFSLMNQAPFTARILYSEEFRHSWKERYAERTVNAPISASLAEKLSVVLHVEAGRTELTAQEWKSVSPGDFLLLSHSTIDPSKEKGRVMLTFEGRPMYRARLKDGSLKILEFPLYSEVEATMAKKTAEFDEGEEFEAYDLHDDDVSYTEGHADDSLLDDDLVMQSEHGEDSEDKISDDLQDLDENSSQEHLESSDQEEEHQNLQKETKSDLTEQKEPEPLTVDSLPLTIVIEVGRIQISVRKLLEMQTGDLLELDLNPDSGVDLVVNGVVIGKGELLKVGETLGVRLLDKA